VTAVSVATKTFRRDRQSPVKTDTAGERTSMLFRVP
jgi:hypothetical protein